MNPKTKLQVQVFSLSKKLPELTPDHEQWAFKNCVDHVGFRTTRRISCLDCGHVWVGPQRVKSCECPKCNVKIRLKDTLKRNLDQYAIFAIIDLVEGFQVNRLFEIKTSHSSGYIPKITICEVVQQWFTLGGKLTIVGRLQCYSNSSYSGKMEIRGNISNYYNSNKYDIYVNNIYPQINCHPIYKRNGFSDKVEGVFLYSFMEELLKDSKLETLLKAKQYSLVSARRGDHSNSIYKYWDTIKICIRNKYIVKDAVSYLDYLDMLHAKGKDLRSPKYTCPVNFKREHDRLVEQRTRAERIVRAEQDRKRAEQRKLQAEREQIAYAKERAPYFGLYFSADNIQISILQSVHDFITEGEELEHCVYVNHYYTKPDTICFSACVDGKRTETIEVSLTNLNIIQSRGFKNKPSEYHDQIVDLMNRNMNEIRKVHRSVKKSAHLVVDQMEAA